MGAGNPYLKPVFDGFEPKTYYVDDSYGEDFLGFIDDFDNFDEHELFENIAWTVNRYVKELKPLDDFEMLGNDLSSMGRFATLYKIAETDDENISLVASYVGDRTMIGVLPIGYDDFYEKIQFTNNKDSEALRKLLKFDLNTDDDIIDDEIKKAYVIFLKKVYKDYEKRLEKALKKSELSDYVSFRTGAWTTGKL